jgi:hypothetical protein
MSHSETISSQYLTIDGGVTQRRPTAAPGSGARQRRGQRLGQRAGALHPLVRVHLHPEELVAGVALLLLHRDRLRRVKLQLEGEARRRHHDGVDPLVAVAGPPEVLYPELRQPVVDQLREQLGHRGCVRLRPRAFQQAALFSCRDALLNI